MIIVTFSDALKKLFHKSPPREAKTRKYTRAVIKKYKKTLRRLSYE